MKKKSLKTLRNKLDKVFSIYIRMRGADENGTNTCVSCGAVKHWKELQCGHYYRRVHLGTRWNDRNCWPQCPACNVLRRGNYANFARFMLEKVGKDGLDELHELHLRSIKYTQSDLEKFIEIYSLTDNP